MLQYRFRSHFKSPPSITHFSIAQSFWNLSAIILPCWNGWHAVMLSPIIWVLSWFSEIFHKITHCNVAWKWVTKQGGCFYEAKCKYTYIFRWWSIKWSSINYISILVLLKSKMPFIRFIEMNCNSGCLTFYDLLPKHSHCRALGIRPAQIKGHAYHIAFDSTFSLWRLTCK